MSHDHYFGPLAGGRATRMRDVFRFESPGGWLGHWFDTLFLKGYLTRFLKVRNAQFQQQAEATYAAGHSGAEPVT
jgi:hypothetical protein